MSARSHSESPLDGLITCGACGRPMGLDRGGEDRKPRYVCPSALPKRAEGRTFEISFPLPGSNHAKTKHQGQPVSQSNEARKTPKK